MRLEAAQFLLLGEVLVDADRDAAAVAVARDDDVFDLEFEKCVCDDRYRVRVAGEDLAEPFVSVCSKFLGGRGALTLQCCGARRSRLACTSRSRTLALWSQNNQSIEPAFWNER